MKIAHFRLPSASQKTRVLKLSNIVILPPMSRTLRVFKPIFVSLEGLKIGIPMYTDGEDYQEKRKSTSEFEH